MANHESKHENYRKKELHAELYMSTAVTSQPWTPSQKNQHTRTVFRKIEKIANLTAFGRQHN